MKKTLFENRLDIVDAAFICTGASKHVSRSTLRKNLNGIFLDFMLNQKKQPDLTFPGFCINRGREVVMLASSPQEQLVRAKMVALTQQMH